MSLPDPTPGRAAFVAALAEMYNPGKTSSVNAGNMKYKFAPLPDILDQVRPILAKHGLAVWFPLEESGGKLLVSAAILHASGEVARSTIPAPADGKEQAIGIRVTYYRRYALAAVLGIAADDDADGDSGQATTQKGGDGRIPEFVAWVEEQHKGRSNEVTAARQATYGRILSWAERRAGGAAPADVLARISASPDVMEWVRTGIQPKRESA